MDQIIDRQRIRQAFDNAVESYDEAAVLQKEVCSRLMEKLDVVKLSPRWILDAGTGTGEAVKPLQQRFKKADIVLLDLSERMLAKAATRSSFFRKVFPVCGDIESLPLQSQSFELVFSNLALQWCNDMDAALSEFRRILKPGSLLVFTTFGPDTLKELRSSWQQLDQAVHVNAFIDMHDIGDGLLRHGFAEPVMESEIITVNYKQVDSLMHDLKAIGANVTASGHRQGMMTKNMLMGLRDAYEVFRKDDVLPATYEIIYGHAWVPEHGPDAVEDAEGVRSVDVTFKR